MAEKPAGERTEQPTARRLAKSREEGQVPQSQELPSALVLIAMLTLLWMLGEQMIAYFSDELKESFAGPLTTFQNSDSFLKFANEKLLGMTMTLMPFYLGIAVAGIAGCVAVSGLNYAPKALKLKLNAINPIAGFGKLFSMQSLVTLLISIAKLTFVIIIVYLYLRNKIDDLPALRFASVSEILVIISKLVFGVFFRVCLAVLILSLADVFYQKWKYINDLKMTRDEVKRERKEDEGSPEVKRRIRMLQIEMASKRMLQEVPKANVVLVNPTHVACALKYDPKTNAAPVLIAKGGDNMCEKIKEIARAYGVPIVHRPELARSIFKMVEPGDPIPETLYVAVAEILAMIYRLRHRR